MNNPVAPVWPGCLVVEKNPCSELKEHKVSEVKIGQDQQWSVLLESNENWIPWRDLQLSPLKFQ